MMQTYLRKQIDIIIDAPLARRITEKIDDMGMTGYTVFRAIAGSGSGGPWHEDLVTGTQTKVLVKIITTEEKAAALMDALSQELERYSCILTQSSVEVLREGKFS